MERVHVRNKEYFFLDIFAASFAVGLYQIVLREEGSRVALAALPNRWRGRDATPCATRRLPNSCRAYFVKPASFLVASVLQTAVDTRLRPVHPSIKTWPAFCILLLVVWPLFQRSNSFWTIRRDRNYRLHCVDSSYRLPVLQSLCKWEIFTFRMINQFWEDEILSSLLGARIEFHPPTISV